jgi:L-alanine-DL-glutamate epimerase-like enolase superfamily enzyme
MLLRRDGGDMQIQRLETFATPTVALVRLTTDDGATSWGQISPYNADIATTVFHRQVAPHALGERVGDGDDVADLAREILRAEYKHHGTYVRRALCGLDTALWDALGREQGAPVCELVGGEPTDVPIYGSSMRRDIEPDDEADRLREWHEERGVEAFKIRIGRTMGEDRDQWPGRTEALVSTVREAVPDATLLVDANGCYSAERAVEVARDVLIPGGVVHYEEPCPFPDVRATAEVREALDDEEIDVTGGEQDNELTRWRRLIGTPVVDVIQPDVCYIGGFSRALRVARMADDAGLPCVPHSANHSMVLTFTLHLMAAIDNAGPSVEYSIKDHWAEGMYEPAPEVDDGTVAVPDGPGWGVEPVAETLATADYEVSEP